MPSDRKHDLPALCSLLCPGLGQVVKGEFAKGLAFFVGSLPCFPIFWPWSVIDAYNHDPAERAAAAAPGLSETPPVSTGAYKVLGLTVLLLSLGFIWGTASGGLSPLSFAAWLPWWAGLFPAAFGGTMIHQAFQVEVKNRQEREKARVMRLEREILQLAQKKAGRVTSVDVATHCGATLDDAREMLDRMAKKGHVGVSVTDDGAFVYRVLDMAATDARLLDEVRRAEVAAPSLPLTGERREEPRKQSEGIPPS